MGLGEGVAFPAIYNLYARWIPTQERARAAALNTSGVPLGTVGALLLTPTIVLTLGWPWVFTCSASWASCGTACGTADHRYPRQPSRRATLGAGVHSRQRPAGAQKRDDSVGAAVNQGAGLGHYHQSFCSNWGFYVLLTWLPTYFTQALGVDLSQVGLYTILPWLAMF